RACAPSRSACSMPLRTWSRVAGPIPPLMSSISTPPPAGSWAAPCHPWTGAIARASEIPSTHVSRHAMVLDVMAMAIIPGRADHSWNQYTRRPVKGAATQASPAGVQAFPSAQLEAVPVQHRREAFAVRGEFGAKQRGGADDLD